MKSYEKESFFHLYPQPFLTLQLNLTGKTMGYLEFCHSLHSFFTNYTAIHCFINLFMSGVTVTQLLKLKAGWSNMPIHQKYLLKSLHIFCILLRPILHS